MEKLHSMTGKLKLNKPNVANHWIINYKKVVKDKMEVSFTMDKTININKSNTSRDLKVIMILPVIT